MVTGDSLPLSVYIIADIVVLAVIFTKAIIRAGPKDYPTAGSQLRGLFFDLTVWDRCVAALFLLGAWPVYISTLDPYYQWWALYYITAAQFMFAGMEPLANWWLRRRARLATLNNNVFKFAPAYGRVRRYLGAEPPPSYRPANHTRMRGGGSD